MLLIVDEPHPRVRDLPARDRPVVDEVAEELEEIGAEPTREEIRQRVYDRVEVRAEFVDEERHPLVDRVANAELATAGGESE